MKQNYFRKIDIRGRVRVCIETASSLGLKGKYIIDVGSSIGWLEKELLVFKPKKILGIEPDKEAVKYAQKKVPQAEFLVGTADKIPAPSSVADIVIMFDVIEHVPKDKEQTALNEVSRVLKRGGRLALSTPNYNWATNLLDPAWYLGHRHYKPEHLKRMLKKAGFKIEKFEVRAGLWFSAYLIWHYTMKWIFKKPFVGNEFMMKKDDEQFSKKGFNTIFLTARKI